MLAETKAAGTGADGGMDRPAENATGRGAADIRTRQAILQALDLPPEAMPQFLQHIEQFCHAHGGDKHYGDLLTLLARYRSLA